MLEELLNKYGLPSLEIFRKNMQPGESEIMYYEQFLKSTDHIPLKLIEGSVASSDVAEELKYGKLLGRKSQGLKASRMSRKRTR